MFGNMMQKCNHVNWLFINGMFRNRHRLEPKKEMKSISLLPASVELLHRAKFIKQFLVHQSRDEEKLVVRYKFINDLFLHPFSLENNDT
jgi:hypothetical protein